MKYNVLPFFFILCLCSGCSSDGLSGEDYDTLVPIEPAGVIDGEYSATRAPAVAGNTYDISLFRADDPYASAGYLPGSPYNGKIEGNKVTTGLYYLSNPAKTSKLLGIYPATGTNVVWASAGRTVTYSALDGKTDIICSQLVAGSKNSPMKEMAFEHLLTRLNVEIKCKDANAVGKWGAVNSITLTGAKSGIVVTLPGGNTAAGTKVTTGSASTAGTYVMRKLDNDGTPDTTAPALASRSYGYTMFPPTTTESLKLSVVTAVDGTFTANLPTQAFTAGNMYTVTLEFTTTNIVVSSVSISDWKNTDLDSIPIN